MPPIAALLLLLPQIWIVDAAGGPGVHFTDLPSAIAAAADGDTLLVRAGSYSSFEVPTTKALLIRGAGAASTQVLGSLARPSTRVLGTPATGSTVLQGMRFEGFGQGGSAVVLGTSAPARVLLLDCQLRGAAGDPAAAGLVVSGGLAHAVRCWIRGGDGSAVQFLGSGGRGVTVAGLNTSFAADQCEILGGDGDLSAPASQGGAALTVVIARARIDRSLCVGGTGAANGGNGLESTGMVDARFAGDASAQLAAGFNAGGVRGNAVHLTLSPSPTVHGSVQVFGGFSSGLGSGSGLTLAPELPRLAVSGASLPSGETNALQLVAVDYLGLLPNAPYFFAIGFTPAVEPAAVVLGGLLVDLPSAGLTFGALDASGRLAFSLLPAAFGPGALGVPFVTQAGTFDAAAMQIRSSNVDARIYAL